MPPMNHTQLRIAKSMAFVAFTPTGSRCGMWPIILKVRIRFSRASAPTAKPAMIALQITPSTVSRGMPCPRRRTTPVRPPM
ncbi:Uncharacterised protein [Mycobacteroides abscessus subsp. massiliense]|nr:Uncharacterised protein [Mycobacteroides abscessus subsp. massiliense]